MRLSLKGTVFGLLAMVFIVPAVAQESARKEFPPGLLRRVEDLPPGRFRIRLERLPKLAQDRAVAWLREHHISREDFASLHADPDGGIFYADTFELPQAALAEPAEPTRSEAAVPIDPFPADITFHSKPGAPNVLYLDFTGATVSNIAWNDSEGTATYQALAFSIDSDYSTFSDAERLAIKRIWQRVAEDYAAFDIDVTTEQPSTFGSRTAHALITRNTDANGAANPASTSGGVAYLGVFANSTFNRYRPAWIYHNNLGNSEAYVAEAVSHEIGHNMGLSHDGTTSGTDYYGGHGSGETSWGPLMGTGYNRNVSQWSKGEYYQANNTQDDLATIAAKISYRSDDHGNSVAAASPLVVGAGGTISSTTPETDPTNTAPGNKGILERNSDTDMFVFTTGAGQVTLRVTPWIVPSGSTRGGNVDLVVTIYNPAGQVMLADNAAAATGALAQTNLAEGIYYLAVKNTAVGNPLSSSPSGYTAYGGVGQYFISGSVVPSGIVIPPGAELVTSDLTEPGQTEKTFTVLYSDNLAIDATTIGNDDVRVTGPNGYSQVATLVGIDQSGNGSPRLATYRIVPPGNAWTPSDNGTYTVTVLESTVRDTEGAYVPAGTLGTFNMAVPSAIYVASMDVDPGWTLSGLWQYGAPRYAGVGPTSGATGSRVLAYNLSGNYENRLSPTYATTTPIDCSGVSSATLQFQRFLRLRNGDTANIQISTNGTAWVSLWSTTQPVTDESWQVVQYELPTWALRPTLRIRWGIASGQNQNDIGWNIDDLSILGEPSRGTTSQQAIISSHQSISVPEEGQAVFTLRLAAQPNSDVTVITTVTGDPDIFILSGATNVFTPQNWNIPASVTLTARADSDADTGLSSIQCAAAGLTPVTLIATEQEPPPQPQIVAITNTTSGPRLTVAGTPDVEHVVEATSDLRSWLPLTTNTPSSGTFFFQDTNSGANRFYRVTAR